MPALAPVVDTLETVPENARTFYEQKDGKFVLALNGAPVGFVPAADLAAANGKVVEFRDNNVKLTKEVETLRPLKTQFDGIDPVVAKAAIAKIADLEKGGVKSSDDVSVLIKTAVEAAVAPLQATVAAQQKQTEAERKRADDAVLRQTVSEKFLKAGGKPKAVDYVLGQATSAFTVENGSVKANANLFSAVNPGSPLTVDEWIGNIAKEHDFAFEPSGGGGADPKRPAAGLRPGQTILMDPTPAQLGEYSGDIAKGKVKVQYSK